LAPDLPPILSRPRNNAWGDVAISVRVPYPTCIRIRAMGSVAMPHRGPCEHKEYITHVRSILVEHPLLVLEIGLRPPPDPTQPYACDVAHTVPCARWLCRWQ
jgi:hypothetical protein